MRIAVVGLGAAGCRACMLLAQAGVDVTAFEVREQVGGRLQTVKVGSGFYEAGGEWIDSDNQRILDLLNEFGLNPEVSNQYPGRVIFKGEQCLENQLWADVAGDVSRLNDASDFVLLDLEEVPWENVLSFDLDQRTLRSFINEKCDSPRGKWWLEASLRSDEGEDLDQIGLLGWMCGQLHYLQRDDGAMSAYRFPTGAQEFCRLMLSASGVTPRLGMNLRRAERELDQVHLYFDDHAEAFDHVILTLPPPALRSIVFDPPLHESKEEALQACGMSRTVKIAFHLSEHIAFRAFVDGPLQQVWDGSRAADAPIMMAYVCGHDAEILSGSSDPAGQAKAWFDEQFPQLADAVHSVTIHDWINDPHAGGGFSYIPPGYVLTHMEAMNKPDGRIHFAGEHTSTLVGFIEGALESAERVVEEIL